MLSKVVCIKFKKMKTVQFFNPGDIEDLEPGNIVIVETYRGTEQGTVKSGIKMVPSKDLVAYPLRDILRKATEEDLMIIEENQKKEEKAYGIAEKKIYHHNLPMKLIDVEYLFDKKKIIFYFSADGRIDFRKLVKDLAGTFRTRIELHQIGVRDDARMLGGLGHCGREVCCATFLNQFSPVSIKMAKEQSLSLNPVMISGLCGRLMCCLKYEYDVYRKIKSELPPIGSDITLPEGKGIIIDINVPRSIIIAELPNSIRVDVIFDRVKELEKEGKVLRAKDTYSEENLEDLDEEETEFGSIY
jgi:cell fate regulator YaaT (PSP1 superfamily)